MTKVVTDARGETVLMNDIVRAIRGEHRDRYFEVASLHPDINSVSSPFGRGLKGADIEVVGSRLYGENIILQDRRMRRLEGQAVAERVRTFVEMMP